MGFSAPPPSEQARIVEQRGPFTVTKRELKHNRFGMQLIADTVIRHSADGIAIGGEQFWVNFPCHAVLIFAVQGDVLYLTREFTYGTGEYSLEVPGGMIEEGETPEQAAQRELHEELGLHAEALIYLGVTRDLTSRVNNKTHLFLASGVQVIGEACLEPGEVIQGLAISLENVYNMMHMGEITTAAVEVGIWRLQQWLNGQASAR